MPEAELAKQQPSDQRFTFDDKIDALVKYFPTQKPRFTENMFAVHPESGESVLFRPGKFLNNLLQKLPLPDNDRGKEVTNTQLAQLRKLTWFEPWLEKVRNERMIGKPGGAPTLTEETLLVANHYPRKAPVRGQTITVERRNNKPYSLNAAEVMDKIKINWHEESAESFCTRLEKWKHGGRQGQMPRRRVASRVRKIDEASKRAIEACEWFETWQNKNVERREVARKRKVVCKETKINLICNNYTGAMQPRTADCLEIQLDSSDNDADTGDVFFFYPVTFMDDICNNWFNEERANVVLNDSQIAQFEALPWFANWLTNVRNNRMRKRRREQEKCEANSKTLKT